jgi:hypothetical protein
VTYLFFKMSKSALGTTKSTGVGVGALSSSIKRPGPEADPLPVSTVAVNECSKTLYYSCMPSRCVFI